MYRLDFIYDGYNLIFFCLKEGSDPLNAIQKRIKSRRLYILTKLRLKMEIIILMILACNILNHITDVYEMIFLKDQAGCLDHGNSSVNINFASSVALFSLFCLLFLSHINKLGSVHLMLFSGGSHSYWKKEEKVHQIHMSPGGREKGNKGRLYTFRKEGGTGKDEIGGTGNLCQERETHGLTVNNLS